jgi:DNA-binding beta-propeller fold protein YncE
MPKYPNFNYSSFQFKSLLLACMLHDSGGWLCAQESAIQTVAGTGEDTLGEMSGVATQVNVGQPFGVEIGKDNALYITEVSNHRVLRMDRKTGQVTTVAGTGEKGLAEDGEQATAAKLNEPYEVRFDDAGNMYFVEMMNHIVRKVDVNTGKISSVAGTGEAGYNGDAGKAIAVKLNRPHSIVVDAAGEFLYIADIGNHRIRRVNLTTGLLDTIAGNGSRSLPKDGQVALAKPLAGPRALFLQEDVLWIALREGHSVWTLNLNSGKLTHIAGTGKKGFSGDGGPALEATFNGPKGIAVGPTGNVFVVDTENQVIRKIDMKTKIISTVAGAGLDARGYSGDGGKATAAKMDRPHGICVDDTGNIYIGDTNNHRVRSVSFP